MASAEYPAQEETQNFTQLQDVHKPHTGVFQHLPLPHG